MLRRYAKPGEYDRPLPGSLRTYLGAVLVLSAQRPHYRFVRVCRYQGPLAELEVQLPARLRHASYPPERLEQMGEALNRHFTETFLAGVQTLMAVTGNEMKAIQMWLDSHDVDPNHWDFMAARRCWRDQRTQLLAERRVNIDGAGSIDMDEFRSVAL